MNVTKRLLGISLIFVGLLAFIDWGLSFVILGGSRQPIRDLILYGNLYTAEGQHILTAFGSWLCGGNGYAWFCAPLGIFIFLIVVLAVVICPVVNFTRGAAPTGGKNRRLQVHNLAFYASVVVAVGYCWPWIHFTLLGPDYGTAVSVIYLVVATVTPPLFVVATIGAGSRLLRIRG